MGSLGILDYKGLFSLSGILRLIRVLGGQATQTIKIIGLLRLQGLLMFIRTIKIIMTTKSTWVIGTSRIRKTIMTFQIGLLEIL